MRAWIALGLAATVSSLAAVPAAAQPREAPIAEARRALVVQGGRYGTLADDHEMSRRVSGVFEQIVRAAGRRPGLVLEAHVLDTPRVILEAVRGGLVVISRGAVDLTRGDDHALAFLLGHEVAHLTRDHHATLESLGVLGAGGMRESGAPSGEGITRAYHAVEVEADRLGMLYAALAGYRVAAAVPILMALVERAGPDAFHPDPKARSGAIQEQIREVADHLEVFHLGLFLLGAGRPLEAARTLEHFLTLFPSREVLSAVGVAYHREALRHAPSPAFRHALVVDAATRAPTPKGEPGPAFKRLVERAIHYYTLAAQADPAYAPAHANLGAAHLDLGERELALGHIARALKHAPELAAAYLTRGVAWAAARDWERAEQDWLQAARLDPTVRQSAQNLARLYEARGRPDETARWATRGAEAPAGALAAEAIGGVTPGTPLSRLAAWLEEPGVRQIRLPLGDGRELTLLILSRRGLVALVERNVVEVVGMLPHARAASAGGVQPGDATARVEAAYGRAQGLDGVQALNIWGYPSRGIAIFAAGDRVQSVWAGRPAGKAQ